MKKFPVYVVALLVCFYAGMTAVAHAAYPEKITTTSPYVNIKRPKDDPRWAKAFSHWDKRSSTKEVEAALAIIESISKDKPDDVLTNIWLARVYYHMAMRKRKQRDFYAKKGIAAANKALALDETFAPAHNNLALAYFHKEEYQKAIEHCDKAQEYGFDVKPEFLKDLEPHR